MGWVCKYCSTNNEDSATRCIVCDNARSYAVTRTLTRSRVSELGLSGDVIIPEEYNVVGAGAFQNRTDITSVTIHSGVKKILKDAFSGCINLRDVHNHAELSSIGARAFYGCRSLPSTKRPTARYVYEKAFAGCETHTSSGDRPTVPVPSVPVRLVTDSSPRAYTTDTPSVTIRPPTVIPHTSRAEEARRTSHRGAPARKSDKHSGLKWFARAVLFGMAAVSIVAIILIFKQVF